MKILLVEPDKVLARSYVTALAAQGHDVWVRTEAQTALDVMDEQAIDLVILELKIAKHNGVEFLHELRSYAEWLQVPVIIHSLVPLTDRGMEGINWSQLGVRAYLYKPQTTLLQLTRAVGDLQFA